jgi:hypothetical protein
MPDACRLQPATGFLAIRGARGRLDRTAMKYPAYRVNLTELSPQQMCGRNEF